MGIKGKRNERKSWLDEGESSTIDERAANLEHFVAAMADGVIDKDEVATQEERLKQAIIKAEAVLDDEQHELLTDVLVELTAFNVMKLLHELANERMRR